MCRRREAAGVNDADLTAFARPRGRHRFHVEGVLILRGNRFSANLCLVLLEGLGQAARKDGEWRPGRLGEDTLIQPSMVRPYLGRYVRHRLGEKHGSILRKVPLVKD